MTELICQGAEGRIYATQFCGRPAILKERLSKSYRVPELDRKINRQRILQEARCIVKCRRAGVLAPSVYLIDLENNRLYIEKIPGQCMKELLWDKMTNKNKDEDRIPSTSVQQLLLNLAKSVGAAVGKLHDAEVVHGDLTTSNILVKVVDGKETVANSSCYVSEGPNSAAKASISMEDVPKLIPVLIDFGLGMMKPTLEDKAVDLYVLERAFISTHPGSEYLVQAILESYRFSCRKGSPVLEKLEQVRMRGRKRDMTG
mmetsp:Transcript_22388/g.37445  ORF Transcript_22388/g.37445 Transcript_22388/m.37445 type:complete len:258 (+) Transcript_22388:53-826(+)|eukprot:CAMPEP_0175038050 /NCGR_PEP_ID=MMETSP0005-20121125/24705_1 /TAXON_ID=420556 /ORGANISM="Ochromonas sp., Strain CCMP1393" /LENGTH=257 /DNA_ID=CAMNT_0016299467 /DNA_START=23 /DNA_END=796 /DNA_ORIENTATION=+